MDGLHPMTSSQISIEDPCEDRGDKATETTSNRPHSAITKHGLRVLAFASVCSLAVWSIGAFSPGKVDFVPDTSSDPRDKFVPEFVPDASSDQGRRLWNEVVAGQDVWVPLRNGHVVREEGNEVGVIRSDLPGCERACTESATCESFVHCADWKCYMKDKVLSGTERTLPNKYCSTYFHASAHNAYRPFNQDLLKPSQAELYTFYMYRAQGESTYPPQNVNMASLAGVMWYMHSEVACHCPRRFSITRILRYKVQYRATQPLFKRGMHFGVRYAFDSGKCTGPWACDHDTWDKYGYIIGCNDLTRDKFPFPDWSAHYPGAVWYSIPGKCPSQRYTESTVDCRAREPGGFCDGTPTGTGNCTYNYEEAGSIELDDVVGINNGGDPLHRDWCKKGCREYAYWNNRGKCTNFWNDKKNRKKNTDRVNAVDAAFKAKYPDMPSDSELRSPGCDFNRQRYYAERYEVLSGRRLEDKNGSFLDDPFYNVTTDMGFETNHEQEASNSTSAQGRRLEFTYCIENYNGE